MSSGPKSQSSSVSPQSSDGANEPIGSIISPPNTSRGGKNEENPGSGIQLRTSARVSKKLKLEAEAAAQPPPEPKEPIETKKPPEPEKPPKRKAHELWSTEDKNIFFEALNECGKDFDGIAKYMMGKVKKKGGGGAAGGGGDQQPHCSKTRAQVRCFYYRTWHKIAKHLNFPEGIQKLTQELYGLINFGEMRKKCGVITLKNCFKLNELIFAGSTQIRVKGKTLRVRTPNCRAMRKVNRVVDSEEDKIPGRIVVEFQPKDKSTWLSVQSLALNPRVKTTVTHHTKVSTLLNYLQKVKWKQVEGLLRVAPQPDATISLPQVKRNESSNNSYCAFSLLNHEKKFGSPPLVTAIMALLNQIRHSTPGNRKRQRVDSSSEKAKVCEREGSSSETEKKEPVQSCYDVNLPAFSLPVFSTEEEGEVTVNIPGCNPQPAPAPSLCKTPTTSPNKEEAPAGGSEVGKDLPKVDTILKGWTLDNVHNTQVGHLYSMFGNEGKVILSYSWEDVKPDVNISATLQHMLLVAKLILNKKTSNTSAHTCSCGHSCDGKPNVASADGGAKSSGDTFKRPKPKVEPHDEFQAQLDKFQPKSYTKRFRSKNLIVHRVHPLNASPSPPTSLPSKSHPTSSLPSKSHPTSSVPTKSHPMLGHNAPSSSSTKSRLSLTESYMSGNSHLSVHSSHTQSSTSHPLVGSSHTPSTSHPLLGSSHTVTSSTSQSNISMSGENPAKIPISCSPRIASMPLLEETGPYSHLPTNSPTSSGKKSHLPSTNNSHSTNNSPSTNISSLPASSCPVQFSSLPVINPSSMSTGGEASASSSIDNGSAHSSNDTNDFLGNLLDTSMSSTVAKEAVAVLDELMDISFPHSEHEASTSSPSSFTGLIPGKEDSMSLPPSPSKLLKEGENKWLTSEVADYSLSSLLGHLDSPVKPNIPSDMQSMISETSVDYMAKFADLAAQMANDETCKN